MQFFVWFELERERERERERDRKRKRERGRKRVGEREGEKGSKHTKNFFPPKLTSFVRCDKKASTREGFLAAARSPF